ncbi:MAG TPA: crossover junction endodeoxyribonuclease RuvC [Candidatus Acidoferrum sp.]|nr:crossover junction endodeoxyribonuclease RuvC [Candidatus Acidoferrum sp.]
MTARLTAAEAPSPRRILGVDPAASGPTGYGVIETDGRTFRVLHYGALRIAAKRQKSSAGACLHDVHALLCQLIEEFQPNAMAVESVFTALNMRTALRLAEVRGVVLLAAEQHGVEVRSYSPREVKACVAGYGHADKKQMQLMVRALLKMEETPEPSDAADALAVALCHIRGEQFARRFGLSTGTRTAPTQRVVATSASRRQSTARISGLQPNR